MRAVVCVLGRQRSREGIGLKLLVLLLTGSVAVCAMLLLGKPSPPAVTVQRQVHRCVLFSLVILRVLEGDPWREAKTHVIRLSSDFDVVHHCVNLNQ